MSKNITYFLDAAGMNMLTDAILAKVDVELIKLLNSRLTNNISEESTNEEIPTAFSVYQALMKSLTDTKTSYVVVTELPAESEDNTIYLIKDVNNLANNVYIQWMFLEGVWVNLGGNEVNLSEYWAKSELQAMPLSKVQALCDEILGKDSEEETE